MRIVVFGASGGVGTHAVRHATDKGHDVVAVARSAPSGLPAGATGAAADVRDAGAVRAALEGADAALWCVGVTKTSGGDVGRTGLPHVVAALPEGARVVTVSGAGVSLPEDRKGTGARIVSALIRRFAKDLVEDKAGEHEVLAGSGLVWTEIRPPRLVEAEARGRYLLGTDAPGLSAKPVAKADVALALVELATTDDWARRSPFITRAD